MKTPWFGFLAALILLQPVRADWSDYKAVSFSEAWASASAKPGGESFVGSTDKYKFLVKAVYTGRMRKIEPKRLALIGRWGKMLQSEDFTGHFMDEIEVRADGLTVWLPLPEMLLGPFREEAKAGRPLRLWMMCIGASGEDRLFLVNDFEAAG